MGRGEVFAGGWGGGEVFVIKRIEVDKTVGVMI